jgi:hypothetical protein
MKRVEIEVVKNKPEHKRPTISISPEQLKKSAEKMQNASFIIRNILNKAPAGSIGTLGFKKRIQNYDRHE